jgi:glycosyltransferase involved in cell wall biosynthesis
MILRVRNFWYIAFMRLLFVADGRSPIAINWIRYFAERKHEVFLASTFECSPDLPLSGIEFIPVAYSAFRGGTRARVPPASEGVGLRTRLRQFLGPLTVARSAGRLREVVQRIKPDLVHAMRIPFEGMLAADGSNGSPLVVSVWGNDFTLHATSTWVMRHYTSWTLQVADGLHADCKRDLRLSRQLGLDAAKPTLLAPGNGGVRMDVFHPPAETVVEPVVLNPRGPRAYVRNDIWFQAIPLVLLRRPDARFLCAALAGDRKALDWIRKLGIGRAVELLPQMSQPEMAGLFRRAQVIVSPTTHDGTPNSLLEGMASGCLPVASDLDSIREWITDGKNGLLVDSGSSQGLADAILEALENRKLRRQAAELNQAIVAERADYTKCMVNAEKFYQRVLSGFPERREEPMPR